MSKQKMKTIISCSRRTDIPAFYYDWLQDCLKNETVDVPNPIYKESTSTVDLSPDKIHSIVLWSKNFKNVADNPGFLVDYNLYFQYTITNYNKLFEPNVVNYNETLQTLDKLLKSYSPEQFNIRFDPIIISNDGEKEPILNSPGSARLNQFEKLCKDLKSLGMDNCRITTSYISLYGHVKEKMKDINIIDLSESFQKEFMSMMIEIAHKYGFDLYACANSQFDHLNGMKKGHCIDGDLLDSLFGEKSSKAKNTGQRIACGCSKSVDIGNYTQICHHNCIYCYATK